MSAANISSVDGSHLADPVVKLRPLNPDSFNAIVAPLQKPLTAEAAVTLPKVGDWDADRGVYLGEWAGVYAYAGEDFLRDKNGKQLLLNFNEAIKEFAARNGGRRYGNGSEANIRKAIKTGAYRDGDLVLPPTELVQGRDAYGNTTRREANIYALMINDKLPKVEKGGGDQIEQRWVLSGSEQPDDASFVSHVSLTGIGNVWEYKDSARASAVPVRLYRQPHAARPANTPGG